MTAGEIKFALQVEAILNKITQPEYRQLMVEAIMILCLIVEHDGGKCHWNEMIVVDTLVRHANEVFIKEQVCILLSVHLLPPTKEVNAFARICPSICLLARLLKNAFTVLDKMLHVDRCRDMDELINF